MYILFFSPSIAIFIFFEHETALFSSNAISTLFAIGGGK
jgi:hypothetical protein